MITQGKWEYSVTYLFLACSGIIVILMVIQYGYGINYRSQLLEKLRLSESTGFSMQDIPDYQFSKKEMGEFHDIVERPLFFKGRKSILPELEVESTETVQTSEKLDFILTGIINTPKGLYCLLQNPRAAEKSDKFKRLEQGEEIEGWTIKEIHSDRVVVTTDGKSEEILLAKPRLKPLVKPVVKPKARPNRHKRKINPPPAKPNINPFNQHRKSNNEIL